MFTAAVAAMSNIKNNGYRHPSFSHLHLEQFEYEPNSLVCSHLYRFTRLCRGLLKRTCPVGMVVTETDEITIFLEIRSLNSGNSL